MSRHVFEIEQGLMGFSVTEPAHADDVLTATIADYTAFSCSVTSGALNATANTNDVTTPATWCEPESTETQVGVTSYELAFTFLQDPDVAAGINRFLFEHDTELIWFFMGWNGVDPPKVIGQCRAVAGTIGGAARESLTFDVTLPCKGKPSIAFGDETTSVVIGGAATGAVAGIPGHYTPSGSDPPASVADLIAGVPNTVVASPTSAWTTGQYVATADGDKAHWSGSAWVTAPATFAASSGA